MFLNLFYLTSNIFLTKLKDATIWLFESTLTGLLLLLFKKCMIITCSVTPFWFLKREHINIRNTPLSCLSKGRNKSRSEKNRNQVKVLKTTRYISMPMGCGCWSTAYVQELARPPWMRVPAHLYFGFSSPCQISSWFM